MFDSRKTYLAALTTILLTFSLLSLTSINNNLLPEGDEVAYLGTAIQVKQNGGILRFPVTCLSGQYTEANRHPAYILAISLVAEKSMDFFPKAKIVSFLFGIATLIAYTIIVQKVFKDRIITVIAVLLLAVNPIFIGYSGEVACETMLVLFALLTWYFILKGFEDNRYWPAAGAMNALAYLTKGTGILLLPAFIIAVYLSRGRNILKNRYFWLYIAAFVLLASPLLIRNTIYYGNPIYSEGGVVMWMDKWDYHWKIQYAGRPPNMISYLKSHQLMEMVSRFANGILNQAIIWIYSVSGWTKLSLVIILLFIGGLRLDVSPRGICSISVILIFLVFLSWYSQIVSTSRFILPLFPIVFAYAALSLVRFISKSGDFLLTYLPPKSDSSSTSIMDSFSNILVGVIISSLLFSSLLEYNIDLKNPFDSYEMSGDELRLKTFMETNLAQKDIWLGNGLYPDYTFLWQNTVKAKSYNIESFHTMDEMQEAIRKEDITYVVVNKGLYDDNTIIQEYIDYNANTGLTQYREIPGWTLVFKDDTEPVTYLAYKTRQ